MMDANERAREIARGDGWSRTEYLTTPDGDEYPNEVADRGALARLVADAIRQAVAAERARWVAACWAAYNEGHSEQGWTVLHQMGATNEVPK